MCVSQLKVLVHLDYKCGFRWMWFCVPGSCVNCLLSEHAAHAAVCTALLYCIFLHKLWPVAVELFCIYVVM